MELLSSIKTTEERNRLYSEIELLLGALYKEAEFEKALSGGVSSALCEAIDPKKPKDDIQNDLLRLKKALDELEVIKLTIAFDASESTIDKTISFVRERLARDAIVEFVVEPKILGGAIFEFRGLYADYSLKTRLEEVFKNRREEILKGATVNLGQNADSNK